MSRDRCFRGEALDGGDAARVIREMGYTRAEFAQLLPRVFTAWRMEPVGSGGWRLQTPDGRVAVGVKAEVRPARALGALAIPVLRVELSPEQASVADWQRFLQQFTRGFHRGGG